MKTALASSAPAPTSRTLNDSLDAGVARAAEAAVADTAAARSALPDVAAAALDLCANPKADAAALDKVISRDPFVSGQVVFYSNSAVFAPRTPITGVRDAIVRIGFGSVRDLLMMVVTNSQMFRIPGFDKAVERFRKRSMAGAVASRRLAPTLGVGAEHAFLSGLLHDVGEVALLQRCVREGVVRAADAADPASWALVDAALRTHHAKVGAAVCKAWRLAPEIVNAAERHHDYKNGNPYAHLAALSDVVCVTLERGTQDAVADASVAPPVLDAGLSPSQVSTLITELRGQVAG